MAKTIYKTITNLRVKRIKKVDKYFIYFGNECIKINYEYQNGCDCLADCIDLAESLSCKILNGSKTYFTTENYD